MYVKFIKHLLSNYPKVSLNEVLKHTVCHEYGHGMDARQFASNGVFPYLLRTSTS